MAPTRTGYAQEFAPLLPQKADNNNTPVSLQLVWSQPKEALPPTSVADKQRHKQFLQHQYALAVIAKYAVFYDEEGTPKMSFLAARELGLI